jgi:hypothetical protein
MFGSILRRLPRISQAEDKGPIQLLEEFARVSGLSSEAEAKAKGALEVQLQEGGRAGGGPASR